MNAATLTVVDAVQALVETFSPRIQALFAVKGQIISLQIGRPAKMRKSVESSPVYKYSRINARVGVDYSNQKDVIEKRANGELPATPQPRQWGEWVPGLFPYLATHKGEFYFRFSTVKNENSVREIHWMRDGVEISREEAQRVCLGSEFQEERDLDCFDLRVEHILQINGKEV